MELKRSRPASLMGKFEQMPEVSGLRLLKESMDVVIGLMRETLLHGLMSTLSFLFEVKILVYILSLFYFYSWTMRN